MNGVWDIAAVRAAFPALALSDAGQARVYLDAPGGSQVAGRVVDAMTSVMIDNCANEGGAFRTTLAADRIMAGAHAAAATFVGASSPDEIVFGLNSTSLIFHFSRMLMQEWREGDEIVLTRMDHDGNVGPWIIAAEERGVVVRWLDFDPQTFHLHYDSLDELINSRTKLVACGHASNFLGTINDVGRIVTAAKRVGATTMVDAVPSRSTMTKFDPIDAFSIASMIVSSLTSWRTVRFSGLPGRWAHRNTGRFGSASITVTLRPDRASSQARRTADVDLPAPPFGDAKEMTGKLVLLVPFCRGG